MTEHEKGACQAVHDALSIRIEEGFGTREQDLVESLEWSYMHDETIKALEALAFRGLADRAADGEWLLTEDGAAWNQEFDDD